MKSKLGLGGRASGQLYFIQKDFTQVGGGTSGGSTYVVSNSNQCKNIKEEIFLHLQNLV